MGYEADARTRCDGGKVVICAIQVGERVFETTALGRVVGRGQADVLPGERVEECAGWGKLARGWGKRAACPPSTHPLARLHRIVAHAGQLFSNCRHVSGYAAEPTNLVLGVVQGQRVIARVDVDRVAARQKAGAGRAAEAIRIEAVQDHASAGQCINVGRHHLLGIVLGACMKSHIIPPAA